MAAPIEDRLWTVEEVAKFLQVSLSWVYERCRPSTSDPLPHLKLGKYLRFSKSDLFEYLEARKRRESLRS